LTLEPARSTVGEAVFESIAPKERFCVGSFTR
jgi:hypothetical protein